MREYLYPPLKWRYIDADGVRWWNRSDVKESLGSNLGSVPIWILEESWEQYLTTEDLITYLLTSGSYEGITQVITRVILADALNPLLNARNSFQGIEWDGPGECLASTDEHFSRWLASSDPVDWLLN